MQQQNAIAVHDDVTGEIIGAVCHRAKGFEAWLRLRYHSRPGRTHILLAIDDDEAAAVKRIRDRMTERQKTFNRIWEEIARGDYTASVAEYKSLGGDSVVVPLQVTDGSYAQMMSMPVADSTELTFVARKPNQLWWELD